jgi:hypothetical protein
VHAARKRPLAGCDCFRRFTQGEPVREPGASPSFETFHHSNIGITLKHYGPKVKSLQEKLEREVARAWGS